MRVALVVQRRVRLHHVRCDPRAVLVIPRDLRTSTDDIIERTIEGDPHVGVITSYSIHYTKLYEVGAALLWFGWFGFNAGSQLAADGIAASAFLVTNTSAAMGALAWMFAEWLINKKPTLLGLASGIVAGLVAITPAAGFVNLPAALIIGLVARNNFV